MGWPTVAQNHPPTGLLFAAVVFVTSTWYVPAPAEPKDPLDVNPVETAVYSTFDQASSAIIILTNILPSELKTLSRGSVKVPDEGAPEQYRVFAPHFNKQENTSLSPLVSSSPLISTPEVMDAFEPIVSEWSSFDPPNALGVVTFILYEASSTPKRAPSLTPM